jgi:hypothetical protein
MGVVIFGKVKGETNTASSGISQDTRWHVELTNRLTDSVIPAVRELPHVCHPSDGHSGGCTRTYAALNLVADALDGRVINAVTIVITDGRVNHPSGNQDTANEELRKAADRVKSKSRLMFVTVGDAVPSAEFEQYASTPVVDNVKSLGAYENMAEPWIQELLDDACCEKDTKGTCNKGYWYTFGFANKDCFSWRNAECQDGKCMCTGDRCAEFSSVFPLKNFGHCVARCCTRKTGGSSFGCFSMLRSMTTKSFAGADYCCPPGVDIPCNDPDDDKR